MIYDGVVLVPELSLYEATRAGNLTIVASNELRRAPMRTHARRKKKTCFSALLRVTILLLLCKLYVSVWCRDSLPLANIAVIGNARFMLR